MNLGDLLRGDAPLVIDIPHAGTHLPAGLAERLTPAARALPDTDWHVEKLFAFAREASVTMLVATHSRYVVDLNRDPSGVALYPGADNTELCPARTFANEPLYADARAPDANEVAVRRAEYFDPYHQALAAELERKRAEFGCVVLYDAHSIRSRMPRLFEGELPQFNIGTNNGATCSPSLTDTIEKLCDRAGPSRVTNGRFRGGWITRHYGKPGAGIHAVQMELSMRGYLQEPDGGLNKNNWPAPLDDIRAARLRVALRDVLDACIAFARPTRSTS